MRVDILLATYNGAGFLKEQLESLLAQTHQDWRVLARDDGSSDGTPAILDAYAEAWPGKFTVLRDGLKLGAKGAFSALMAQSSAPCMALCDQDDFWQPEKLSLMLRALHKAEAELPAGTPVLVHCDLEVVDSSMQALAPSFWAFQGIDATRNQVQQLLVENTVTGCASLFNRALVEQALPVPDAAYMHDYWLALVASVLGRIVAVDQPLVRYRQHGRNTLGAVSMPSLLSLPKGALDPQRWSISYAKACGQAEALLERLTGRMSDQNQQRIERFAGLYRHGWLGRRLLLIGNGSLPGRWRRRLSVLARV